MDVQLDVDALIRREVIDAVGPVVALYCGEIQPEEQYHLHGKALSGHRHSHRLLAGESVDDPWHWHEDRRHPDTVNEAIYPEWQVAELLGVEGRP